MDVSTMKLHKTVAWQCGLRSVRAQRLRSYADLQSVPHSKDGDMFASSSQKWGRQSNMFLDIV